MSNKMMSYVDEELNRTEIGQFVARNKVLVISVILAAFLGVAIWGITSNMSEKQQQELSKVIYDFEKNTFKQLEEKKIDGKDYVNKFAELLKVTGSYHGAFTLSIQSADLFIERGELNFAKDILEKSQKELKGSNPFVAWFLNNRLAVVYEDSNDLDNAVAYLKKMNASSVTLMESKVYLDLGRIYLKMGKKEDAMINFKYVVDHFSDSNFAKIAKLYLNDMN
ncbi:MAG: hypothetical protein A2381_20040 [Bdellovibrionales bacterium RIFOXYB1_FULL_37_110]|nr:MAG: hypothetical protein A2181_03675 [Bdellovibrionales bacterium RIFOXYA1_FULL_38_20]OFZ51029.1 MAG: hypothetical protein A2417_19825 [Bdellovibrionales bacterium RIFOXYC1_FULL_37_79]OFZ53940.1 MAG: hypothetical protein A2328_04465 [Bdellovibrionales bacterium RIFOXYB2_FULL_36_6]OFZ60241.1 MAG: hypothetical protein A2381_20040 [Bdellovibrionales bacterium RIFOXYB1_FULL_37_110]OFZ63236.1 MAG: hypothetical protein A2577_01355 [Bdellovibrionales bacterium RIFOXYD1_FULL_36_51]